MSIPQEDKPSRNDNTPPISSSPDYRTSARGQFGWAIAMAGVAILLSLLGLEALAQTHLEIGSWQALGWAVLGYSSIGLAVWASLTGLGYAMLGLRITNLLWRYYQPKNESPEKPSSWARFRQALTTPIAKPDQFHPAAEQLKGSPEFDLIELHEASHRQKHGETYAYLRQGLAHIWYLARKILDVVLGDSTHGARGIRRVLREMISGDLALSHILDNSIRARMVLVSVLFVVDVLLAGGISYLLGQMVTVSLLAAEQGLSMHLSHLIGLSTALPVGLLLNAPVQYGYVYFSNMTGAAATRRYRTASVDNMLGQGMEFHSRPENDSEGLANHVIQNTQNLSGKNVSIRQALIYHPCYLAIGLGFLFYLGPLLGVLAIMALGPLGIFLGILSNRMWKVNIQKTAKDRELSSRVGETFANIVTVAASGARDKEAERNARAMDAVQETEEEEVRLKGDSELLKSMGSNIALYLLPLLGIWLLALSIPGFDVGTITQIAAFAGFISSSFANITEQILGFQQADGSSQEIRELMLLPPALRDRPGAQAIVPDQVQGELEFDRVSFSHGGKLVLREVSFHIRAGQKAAFVGESGSGKSTTLNLVVGLIEPEQGRILVDGRNVQEITKDSLLAQIGVVPQDTRLFEPTLGENVANERETTEAEITHALELAGAAEFVFDPNRFPQSLATPIEENGKNLSGGQRQRIAIARALIRNPRFLILDEPTADLDYAADLHVRETLRHLSQMDGTKPTILVASHRLSAVQDADVIFYLEDGRIVEQGSHEELMALNGRYAALHRKQSREASMEPPHSTAAGQMVASAVACLLAAGAGIAAALWASGALAVALPLIVLTVGFLAAGLAFALSGIHGALAAYRHLNSENENTPPATPWKTLWRVLTEPLANPAATESPTGPFALLPVRYQNFLIPHEQSHHVRRVGETRAIVAQLSGVPHLLFEELKTLCASASRLLMGPEWLRPYLAPRWPKLILVFLLLILEAGLALGLGRLLGLSIDDIVRAAAQTGVDFETLKLRTGAILSFALLIPFLTRWRFRISGVLKAGFIRDIRDALDRKVLQWRMGKHALIGSGEITSRILRDPQALGRKEIEVRIQLIQHGLIAAISAVLLIVANPTLGAIVVILVPLLGVVNFRYGAQLDRIWRGIADAEAQLRQFVKTLFSGVYVIKLFGTERPKTKRFDREAEKIVQRHRHNAHARGMNWALTSSLTNLFGRYSIYILGAWMLALGLLGMTPGAITAMAIYAAVFKLSFEEFSRNWVEFKTAEGTSDKAQTWLTEPEIGDAPDAYPLPEPVSGSVEFKGGVDFSYALGKNTLKDVSFAIHGGTDGKRGERVALVGPSGSGKTTALRLIAGWWDPNVGQVLLDGHDRRKLSSKSVERQIVYLTQRPELFNRSLKENILLGSEDATDEEFWEAVEAAQAKEFVLEKGVNFEIGERGQKLSGGQQQRVALARALLRMKKTGAKILLVDEATSALDKSTEIAVQEALRRLNATLIVVAHNLETIMDFDRVIVLDQGRLVQSGSPQALLQDESGKFHQLWQARLAESPL